MQKRYSPSCDNNKIPILQQLDTHFAAVKRVLEIGSGTGQHAAYFAASLPHLTWHCSDVAENHDSINAWINDAQATNIIPPIPFFIGEDAWPVSVDGVFSANTAHIMHKQETQLMMELIGDNLPIGGVFCQYGPFNIDGQFTSDSNKSFHQHLLSQGCGGICDIADLIAWAPSLQLQEQIEMPANNFLLVWKRI